MLPWSSKRSTGAPKKAHPVPKIVHQGDKKVHPGYQNDPPRSTRTRKTANSVSKRKPQVSMGIQYRHKMHQKIKKWSHGVTKRQPKAPKWSTAGGNMSILYKKFHTFTCHSQNETFCPKWRTGLPKWPPGAPKYDFFHFFLRFVGPANFCQGGASMGLVAGIFIDT